MSYYIIIAKISKRMCKIMIIVNCAWRQEDIIEIVENIEVENQKILNI